MTKFQEKMTAFAEGIEKRVEALEKGQAAIEGRIARLETGAKKTGVKKAAKKAASKVASKPETKAAIEWRGPRAQKGAGMNNLEFAQAKVAWAKAKIAAGKHDAEFYHLAHWESEVARLSAAK